MSVRRNYEPKSYVYFIQAGYDGPIKIGYSSDDPSIRLEALQTANPELLRMLAYFCGTHEDEHALHRLFRGHRIRGEWFSPVPEILTYIERCNREGGSLDLPDPYREMLRELFEKTGPRRKRIDPDSMTRQEQARLEDTAMWILYKHGFTYREVLFVMGCSDCPLRQAHRKKRK